MICHIRTSFYNDVCVVGAYEYHIKRHNGKEVDVSRLFIFYNSRERIKQEKKDIAVSITTALDVLGVYGSCKEKYWPYNTELVYTKSTQIAYQKAKRYKAVEVLKVKINLDEMKACLAQSFPIVFGLNLTQSFGQADDNEGAVPRPNPKDFKIIERHAMLAVGYSDRSEAFIVRNSWGTSW
ncbi:unnamed protein product, partial [Didymodactylos carnosus]